MSDDLKAKLVVTADADQAQAEIRETAAAEASLGTAGDAAADDVSAAFKRLGVTSQASLDALAAQAKVDFERIRASGTATPGDLARAWEAYQARVSAAQESGVRGSNLLSNALGDIRGQVLAMGSLTAVTMLAKSLFEAGVRAQALRSRMVFAAGGTAEADAAMKEVNATAGALGQKVAGLADSFIRLKNLGLDPSRDALTAYSNIAAANGKATIDFAEAVADAVTGEFERLKEFGLKASVQGDQVALRFRGQTVTIANDAKAIEAALIRIGNTDFAGAAGATADTAGSAMGRLADSVGRLAGKLAEGSGMLAATSKWGRLLSDLSDAISADAAPSIDAAADSFDRMHKSVLDGGAAFPDFMDWMNATSREADRLDLSFAGIVRQITRLVQDAKGLSTGILPDFSPEGKRLMGVLDDMTHAFEPFGASAEFAGEQVKKSLETSIAAGVKQQKSAAEIGAALEREQSQRAAASATQASIATAQAQMEIQRRDAAAAAAQRAAEADRGNLALAQAASAARLAALDAQVAAEQTAIESAAKAYQQRQVEAAQARGALATLEAQRTATGALTAKTEDLQAARERLSKAVDAQDLAALEQARARLDAIGNAAQRAATMLSGVQQAEQALRDAQDAAAGKGPSNDWADAATAARKAGEQIHASDFAGAAKTIQDGLATLKRAVEAGGPAALIDAMRKQLHDLGVETEAAMRRASAAADAANAPAADKDPAKKGADEQDPATKRASAASQDGAAAAQSARKQLEQAFSTPIPITFDATAGIAALVAEVGAALQQATYSVRVRAILTVDSGGATQTGGTPLSDASAKQGTPTTP